MPDDTNLAGRVVQIDSGVSVTMEDPASTRLAKSALVSRDLESNWLWLSLRCPPVNSDTEMQDRIQPTFI